MLRRSTFLFNKPQLPCPDAFLRQLTSRGFTSYFGVPDSLLKELCKCITYHGEAHTKDVGIEHHVIAANEGNAIGLAAGYHLASSKVPVVYMQNSGLGNCVNPLTSLTHREVYSIPLLMLIGWRGRPGSKKDEPQHVAMGRLTEAVLNSCEVPYAVLSNEAGKTGEALDAATAHFAEKKTPFAILVDRDTFAAPPAFVKSAALSDAAKKLKLSREGSIETILKALPSTTPVVSNTGMISREVFETRKRLGQSNASDFLTVGAMGHCSSIAAGFTMGQQMGKHAIRRVVCIDGDGAFLMHLGAAAVTGAAPVETGVTNLIHIVLNNAAHDSVGGQPTVGLDVDLSGIAKCCGYTVLDPVDTQEGLEAAMARIVTKCENAPSPTASAKPVFLEVRVKKGNRKDLGRPTSSAADNRAAFMEFAQK